MFIHGEQIQVLKPVAVIDEYSGEMSRWSFENVTPLTLGGFAVAPNVERESPQPGRNPIYSGITLYGPVGPDIDPHDRVIVRGTEYEVDGEIADWINPFTGTRHGSVINLKRGDG